MNTVKKWSIVASGTALCAATLAGCGTKNLGSNNTTSGTTQKQSQNQNQTQNDTQNQTAASPTSTDKNITIGYVNWAEDVATTYLWKHLLEQKGYNVTLKDVGLAPMYVALSEGSVDVFFDGWLPQQTPYVKKYKDSVTTLGKWYKGQTKEGFVVPTYMKNVNSISDLNKVKSQLSGQIIGIDAGNVEMQLAGKAVKQYGLNLNLTSSSGPAMLSVLKKAYDAKKDVAVVLWSPHWAFAKYNLKYLSDPKGVFGKAGLIQAEANKKWMGNHPTMTTWLKNFKLTPKQLGLLEDDINHASSKDAGVTKWMNANQSVVSGWFQ